MYATATLVLAFGDRWPQYPFDILYGSEYPGGTPLARPGAPDFCEKAKHTARHRAQMDHLLADTSGLRERDLVIYQVFPESGTGPQGAALDSTLRTRIQKRYAPKYPDFRFILIGKDGTVKWQTDRVADRAALFIRIDRMPMRRAEMKSKG